MRWQWLVCLLVTVGCAHQYTYLAERNLDTNQDLRETTYALWSGAREGTVRVTYLGINDLTEKDPEHAGKTLTTRAIHLRMDVKNEGAKGDLALNIRDAKISIPGRGKIGVGYVDTNVKAIPKVVVKAGEDTKLDLYFPLTEDLKGASKIPDFTFDWTLHTPTRVVARRTDFQRMDEQREVPTVYPSPAYPYDTAWGPEWAAGPYWWYDPIWHSWSVDAPLPPPVESKSSQMSKK